jgi:chromosome segregation ATPase
MTDSTLMTSDLDLLAERVERAAMLVSKLREEKQALIRERDDLSRRLDDLGDRLQGQDATALMTELQQLRKEQKEWHGERRDVATRIESLVKKLERLEG